MAVWVSDDEPKKAFDLIARIAGRPVEALLWAAALPVCQEAGRVVGGVQGTDAGCCPGTIGARQSPQRPVVECVNKHPPGPDGQRAPVAPSVRQRLHLPRRTDFGGVHATGRDQRTDPARADTELISGFGDIHCTSMPPEPGESAEPLIIGGRYDPAMAGRPCRTPFANVADDDSRGGLRG